LRGWGRFRWQAVSVVAALVLAGVLVAFWGLPGSSDDVDTPPMPEGAGPADPVEPDEPASEPEPLGREPEQPASEPEPPGHEPEEPASEPDGLDDTQAAERTDGDRPVDTARTALLVVGDELLTDAERTLRTAIEELGFTVEVVEDAASSRELAARNDVVVISKTVSSELVADTFLETPAGVVFWEDNAQVIEQRGDRRGEPSGGIRGLATIDVVNPEHTAWHHPASDVYVNPAAPEDLRAGLAGPVRFYRESAEMTFAPVDDGGPLMAPSATWVAAYGSGDSGRYVYYVIEADAGLADGTPSHGRRAYFGLYDTFPLLTPAGRSLFDAALLWAADRQDR
jgi:hypothetical protein